MKKLANDPSRNVNAVSGMWVRLRKDGSKYDVRYVNARVKRVWSLSQTSEGTAWNVQARGVQYEDFLNGMKSSSVDLEHGWLLVPDSDDVESFGCRCLPVWTRNVCPPLRLIRWLI